MGKLTVLIAAAVLTLSACGGNQQQGEITYITDENGQEIPLGGTLIHGSISDLNSLNPYTINSALARDLSYLIFLNLVDLNSDLETYSPRLAKSWEFSADRKQLTFYLRDDVYWWDGVKTTARDVVFSNELAQDPQVAWSAIKWKEFIDDVEAVDDTTVVFHFSQVYPYQIMDANVGSIVPEHLLKDIPRTEFTSAEFNTKPVGNGPFMLKSWRSQEQIEFVRNPNYYEPNKPYLDRIVVRIVPDRTTLLTQLKTGNIDFLEQVPPKEFQDMKRDFEMGESDIKPYEFIGRSYDFVAWNTIDGDAYDPEVHTTQASLNDIPNPFFANREVRRAMTLAIDRELIREAIGYGMLIPMNGTISPILWAYDQTVETLPYDPDEARRILQEEG
ncbi:MAG: hypothetical protein GF372_06335, partial [Candidatus Marinimicrobia bacterium]|nr:hypothetical protein [Candidatus Neomarinimicrobiota bacterium]